jgi:hypothetical protein
MSENKEIPKAVMDYFKGISMAESVEELGPYDLSPYMVSGKGDTGMAYTIIFGGEATGYPVVLLYCPEKDTVMEAPTFMAFDLLDQYDDDSEE